MPGHNNIASLAGGENKLRPAELAYLARDGDMTHVLMVLIFDLVHRAIKSQTSQSGPVLTAYEKNIWSQVKDYTSTWAKGEFDKILPNPKKNPVRFVKAFPRLYQWLARSLNSFSRETVADPRRLRRYISCSGLVRLAADFWSAGYQDAIEQQMLLDLRLRGLVTRDATRESWSLILNLVAGAAILSLGVVAGCYWAPIARAATGWVLGALAALCLRGLWFLRELIPLYHEFRMTLAQVKKQGWRFRIVSLLVNVVTATIFSLLALAAIILLLLEIGCLHWILNVSPADAAVAAMCFTATWLLCFQVIFEAHRIRWRAQPMPLAAEDLRLARNRLSKLSPLKVFADMLSNAEYDPALSELLAIYGVETLWLLV